MVKDDEVRRGEPEEERIRLAQQGKIETILGHKESIDLCSLFTPLVVLPPPLPSKYLIEGAPGGGKSTLAFHICYQWAQDTSWLGRFDLVILVYLRDEAIQNAKTLNDIFPNDISDTFNIQNTVFQIQASYGIKVLFVFDGWDEFPSKLMSNSLVSTIIHQPHKLSLQRSTVLITSRPVASGNLLHIADRRIEILGFTQLQIREYIEKALNGNSTRIQKLVQHLEDYPVIEGYCYVPLHVAILVHVFLTMREALPTTLHELFCSLVLCCIAREQATHEPDTSLPELSSLDDLPDDLKSKLRILSILAYNGVMQDKIVFYSKDLQVSHLPSNLSSLGLLQAVEGLSLCKTSLSYNFLHLSVQELLAAYHISQMVAREQVQIFEKMLKSSRFQAVLHFFCGFTKLGSPEIQAILSSFQVRILNFKDLLPLLHCFFEAQQPSLCQLVDHKFIPNEYKKLNSKDLTPIDFLVVGFFITSVLSLSTANTPLIHLVIDDINDHSLKMLLKELSKYLAVEHHHTPACAQYIKLHFSKPSITKQGIIYLASYLEKSSAICSELVLENGVIHSGDILFSIAETMQAKTSLTNLRLRNMGLCHTLQNSVALNKLLQLNRTLTHLDLSRNDLRISIFESLQHNSSLVNLNLSETGLAVTDPDTARSLTETCRVNKSLTHLDLSNNSKFSDSGALCIFEGLQQNSTLVDLNLSQTGLSVTDPNTARSLIEMLQINKSLKHLDLSRNLNMSDLGARCIFEGLQHNTVLVNLNLSQTGVSATDPDTAGSIIKMFQVNKSLTHLDLSRNDYTNSLYLEVQGLCIVFEGLQHNATLTYLNLSQTCISPIDPNTAKSITEMFQVNKSLTHLDLSKNNYTWSNSLYSEAQGLCIAFEGLKHNTTLTHLNLSQTCISATDPNTARSLTEMLRVNKSLKHLDLSRNDLLSDTIAHSIFKALMHNTTLSSLNLSHTTITVADPENANSLIEMLKRNKSLTHLDLSHMLHAHGMISCVFDGLKHNTVLRHLDLSTGPEISHNDAKHIARVLKCNHALQTLNIARHFHSRVDGKDLILESLMFNTTLQTLYISCIDSEALSTFMEKRAAKNLPPIDIITTY